MTTASAAAGPGAVGIGGVYRQPLGLTAYHPSLRKKKWFDRQSSVSMTARQNTLEKSWSLQTDRPLSLLAPYSTESNIIANKVADTLLQQASICSYSVRESGFCEFLETFQIHEILLNVKNAHWILF